MFEPWTLPWTKTHPKRQAWACETLSTSTRIQVQNLSERKRSRASTAGCRCNRSDLYHLIFYLISDTCINCDANRLFLACHAERVPSPRPGNVSALAFPFATPPDDACLSHFVRSPHTIVPASGCDLLRFHVWICSTSMSHFI